MSLFFGQIHLAGLGSTFKNVFQLWNVLENFAEIVQDQIYSPLLCRSQFRETPLCNALYHCFDANSHPKRYPKKAFRIRIDTNSSADLDLGFLLSSSSNSILFYVLRITSNNLKYVTSSKHTVSTY
jgi:hypothetical protein